MNLHNEKNLNNELSAFRAHTTQCSVSGEAFKACAMLAKIVADVPTESSIANWAFE